MKLKNILESNHAGTKLSFDVSKEFPGIWTDQHFKYFPWISGIRDEINSQINGLPFDVKIKSREANRIIFSNGIFEILLVFEIVENGFINGEPEDLSVNVEFHTYVNEELIEVDSKDRNYSAFCAGFEHFFTNSTNPNLRSHPEINQLKKYGLSRLYKALDQFIQWYFDTTAEANGQLMLCYTQADGVKTWRPKSSSFVMNMNSDVAEVK